MSQGHYVKEADLRDAENTKVMLFSEGQHVDIAHRNQLPFRYHGQLGHGGSATVDVVEDQTTGRKFAHKLLHKYYGKDLDNWNKTVRNEIEIMKRLNSHLHIINLYATYVCGRELGMLLLPIADEGDLQAYLQNIQDMKMPVTAHQRSILNRSFGCLASGLAFIHQHAIRHKDIKPKNILVHNGRVIYTDFGISLDATNLDQTTTTGRPEYLTRRYCAPEAANYERRNRRTDVFSLGCVFVEIMSVLETGLDLYVSNVSPYWMILEDVREALISFQTCESRQNEILRTLHAMLEPTVRDRIGSEDLLHRLQSIEISHRRSDHGLFCHDCLPKEATDETTSTARGLKWFPKDTRALSENQWEDSQGTGSGNTDSEEPQMSITEIPPYTKYRKPNFKSFSVQEAITKALEMPLQPADALDRYMYVFWSLGHFGMIKIGYAHDVPSTLKQWEKSCKHPLREYRQDASGKRLLVKYARRVELLVRIELRDVRLQESQCEGCHRAHMVWYRTTPEHATKVIEKFSSWMAKDPYRFDQSTKSWKLDVKGRTQDIANLCHPIVP